MRWLEAQNNGHRIRLLNADLEVLVSIQSSKPTLDWHDYDTVMVHSAVNMLRNELAVLQDKEQSAGTMSARMRAALISAGHRAVRSVMVVGQSTSARSSQRLPGDVKVGLERRYVRFHCSSDADTDEAQPMFERCVSEPMPRPPRASQAPVEAHRPASPGRPISPYQKHPTNADEEDKEAFSIIVGKRLLPLSGTW